MATPFVSPPIDSANKVAAVGSPVDISIMKSAYFIQEVPVEYANTQQSIHWDYSTS